MTVSSSRCYHGALREQLFLFSWWVRSARRERLVCIYANEARCVNGAPAKRVQILKLSFTFSFFACRPLTCHANGAIFECVWFFLMLKQCRMPGVKVRVVNHVRNKNARRKFIWSVWVFFSSLLGLGFSKWARVFWRLCRINCASRRLRGLCPAWKERERDV